jgi:hypothetical protein
LAQIQAFTPACTIKKSIRNNPVSAITHFLPTEEVKNSDHFIFVNLREDPVSAKVLTEGQILEIGERKKPVPRS